MHYMVQSLYGTINKSILSTNGLNIFTIILNNIFQISSLKKRHKLRVWWTQQEQEFIIYKANLSDVGFANTALTMIWCPVFDFRFENIERFRGLYILRDHIPQFCSQVYYGISSKENCT